MNNNRKMLLFQRKVSHADLSTYKWKQWYFLTEHICGLLIRETMTHDSDVKRGRYMI